MCLAIPARVVEVGGVRPELGTVEIQGVRRSVDLSLLDDVVPGEWVLVHVGFAMSKVDEDEARITLALLQEMGEAYDDELRALRESSVE